MVMVMMVVMVVVVVMMVVMMMVVVIMLRWTMVVPVARLTSGNRVLCDSDGQYKRPAAINIIVRLFDDIY